MTTDPEYRPVLGYHRQERGTLRQYLRRSAEAVSNTLLWIYQLPRPLMWGLLILLCFGFTILVPRLVRYEQLRAVQLAHWEELYRQMIDYRDNLKPLALPEGIFTAVNRVDEQGRHSTDWTGRELHVGTAGQSASQDGKLHLFSTEDVFWIELPRMQGQSRATAITKLARHLSHEIANQFPPGHAAAYTRFLDAPSHLLSTIATVTFPHGVTTIHISYSTWGGEEDGLSDRAMVHIYRYHRLPPPPHRRPEDGPGISVTN